jgi:hypothetical protein
MFGLSGPCETPSLVRGLISVPSHHHALNAKNGTLQPDLA